MALSFVRTEKTLLDQTAAGAGNWVNLDVDFIHTYSGLYSVSLETGDWVTIQGRLERSDRAIPFTIAIVSATNTSPGTLSVPYNQVRVVKTGTAGNARIVLYG
jgi:hypothetical protein